MPRNKTPLFCHEHGALIDELSSVVDSQHKAAGNRPVNDRVHRLKILALIHARNWADHVGIEFCWRNIAQPGGENQHRVTALWGGDVLDYDDEWGHRYGDAESDANGVDDACWAGLFSGGGPHSGKPKDRAVALWAEAIIALTMMATFETSHRNDQVERQFAETHDGRLVYPVA